MQDAIFLIVILTGFIAAFAGPVVYSLFGKRAGWLLALAPALIFCLACTWIAPVASGEVFLFTFKWFPAFGVDFSFLIDGLSLVFTLLISVIGALVVVYAGGYMKNTPKLGRFYLFLLLFMAAMLGLVLSDNLITLFVFWELTSITSYMLIGFNHESERARYAALQALLVTGGGGLALFAGLLMLQGITGTFSISEMGAMADTIQSHLLYLPLLILVLLGAFTKSAQFPFHFWLPNAMEAPTPVSAYLHSATMVKAGVYLLARFNPTLGGTDAWHYTLIIFGLVTMLLGAVVAVGHRDLKKILAYTTISSLGVLVMLIGVGTKTAVTAAIGFLLVHSLYKGTLFLVAGAIDHETGTRNIDKLGGLFKPMPIVAIAAVLAALSNAGLPPFIGFIGKELIYESTLESLHLQPALLTAIAVIANMFIVATAIMAGIKPFFGNKLPTPKVPGRAPVSLWIGAVALGSLGLLAGVLASLTSAGIVSPAVDAVLGYPFSVTLKLWHGFNIVLLLSSVTILGGAGIFFLRGMILKHHDPIGAAGALSFDRLYNKSLSGLMLFAQWQTRLLQNGNLRYYLLWIIFTFIGLCTLTLIMFNKFDFLLRFSDVAFYEIVICAIVVLAGVVAVRATYILTAIAALGVVGYGIALLFIFYGATDLAMTLFTIETLTVILFVLVIYKLPQFSKLSKVYSRWRDAVVAVAAGSLITILMLLLLNEPLQSRLSPYFLENSYLMAKGRNVVNVILVDFRAMDTLGEIVVLSVAAIGAYSLMKLRLEKSHKEKAKEKE